MEDKKSNDPETLEETTQTTRQKRLQDIIEDIHKNPGKYS